MEHKPKKRHSGLTLIEVMVAITVIVFGILGAIMFRYYSALDARTADIQVGAGRVALLILEGWKGAAGDPTYDPQGVGGIGLEVLNSPHISISPASGGEHTVELTGGTHTYYYAKPVKPPVDVNGIRKLEVIVTYYGKGSQDKTLPARTIKLSDFVRIN